MTPAQHGVSINARGRICKDEKGQRRQALTGKPNTQVEEFALFLGNACDKAERGEWSTTNDFLERRTAKPRPGFVPPAAHEGRSRAQVQVATWLGCRLGRALPEQRARGRKRARGGGGGKLRGKGWESVALISLEGQWPIHPCLDTLKVKTTRPRWPMGTHTALFLEPAQPSLLLTPPLHPWSTGHWARFPFHHLIVQT